MHSSDEKKLFWLEAIISGAQLGTWIWNVQTGETRFNERWANIIGYSLAELAPISIETWRRLTHPDDLAELDKRFNEHFSDHTSYFNSETRMKHCDGHWMWVRDNAKVITYTSTGQPEWMTGTHIDITEEKTARLGLERLFKISKTVPGMIYEYRLCTDGNSSFPFISEGSEAIYGLTSKQIKENANAVFDAIPERNNDASISWFGQVIDTTDEKQNRLKLERYQADLERAQRIGQLGYWQANLVTGELYWSDMIYEIFGVSKRDFEPSIDAFNNAVHPDDIAIVHDSEGQAKITGVHDVVHRIIRPNGEVRWVHELADFNDNANNTMLVGTVRDITQQKIYEQDLERLSLTDELTGAYNRRYCLNRLEQLFASSVKRGVPVALAVLDIDFFKKVNDTYGHDIGDTVLKQFAKHVKELTRSTDIFARYGGEEFVLIMENCDMENAFQRVERIRLSVENFKMPTAAGELTITLTAGVSNITKQDNSVDDVFKRADEALYLGKKKGRNQVVLAQ